MINKRLTVTGTVVWLGLMFCAMLPEAVLAAELAWTSPNEYRILLTVDPLGKDRSNSPASVEIDFSKAIASKEGKGVFDKHTVEVVAFDAAGQPRVFDNSRKEGEQYLLPCRVDTLYGSTNTTLSFVVLDQKCTRYAVYFDTVESGRGKPQRYPGLVGDGDFFHEVFHSREINASKFGTFCDFDGDGDMDLFKAGVEACVDCYENVGENRMESRGRLSSGGKPVVFPTYAEHTRGWMTVAFTDWDDDGDQDLFPCMGDGPEAGQFLIYENTTPRSGGPFEFVNRGRLLTKEGKSLGGRFVVAKFVDWDGDGKKDVVNAGFQNPMFFRNVGSTKDIQHIELAEGVAIKTDGKDFPFTAAGIDIIDVDNDGDLDLLLSEGRGPIHLFINKGTRTAPLFDKEEVVAYKEPYMIGDAHTGMTAADFDGDGLIDIVGGRYWERTPLAQAHLSRYFGGLFKNIGTASHPKFQRRDASHGSPYTERLQPCDAVRQNAVRAVDWNNDKKLDLIAGDTDGFVWHFENTTDNLFPVFEKGRKLQAGGEIICRFKNGGHARPDITDWDNDGDKDLIIADGGGNVTIYINIGKDDKPVLKPGVAVEADGKPIASPAGRSSVAVADFDNDGKKDLIYSDQDFKQDYRFFRNVGEDAKPVFAAAKPILFDGKPANYIRANLGSFVDWDKDGKKDLIGCGFENDIRLHKNLGSAAAGEEPRFGSEDGLPLVVPVCIQMVSGADVIDFNGDGDLDILTGQGHGGSGLRFYERDYIEDGINKTHPTVKVESVARKGP